MASTVINTREDLDATTGTPEHDAFMALLAGTLWRVEKDDTAQAWVAIEDNSTIERFGFTRADFSGAVAPELPAYVPQPSDVPQVVSKAQGLIALEMAGLLTPIETYMQTASKLERLAWENIQQFERRSPMLNSLLAQFGLTESDADELFVKASQVVI